MITRRGMLEAVGGALAGGSSLPALAGGEAEQSYALWLSPLLVAARLFAHPHHPQRRIFRALPFD